MPRDTEGRDPDQLCFSEHIRYLSDFFLNRSELL